ncbi:MAG: hypothetical protein EOP83_16490 [Verrucomicrobiaceae bacterium]|nr:MAG: hypothetical protein EOP83_16490 [Verrucomicrobiaceae bacterium]
MKITSSIIVLVLITALLHAAPPQAQSSPEDLAKRKVSLEIYAKVSTTSGRFSRAMPMPSHKLEFQPQMLVKDESRLPFTITPVRNSKISPQLQGYVRLSNQQIFLLDPKTGNYRPASEDPRFAPPAPPKIEPTKPL